MSGTLISALVWVPKGRAALKPKRYNLDEDEIQRVGKLGGPGALEKLQEEMAEVDLSDGEQNQSEGSDDWEDLDSEDDSAAESKDDEDGQTDDDGDVEMKEDPEPSDPNDLSAFKLDKYDEEDSKGVAMGAFANIKGLAFYKDNNDDPYITLKEDDDDEEEELELLPTDQMLISARTTSDLSSIDFHVYDDPNTSLTVHHDLLLPAFPLCVEWLDFPSGSSTHSGNFIAVGGFDPSIEIWDADLIDGLYPQAILGPSPMMEKPTAKALGTGKKKRKQIVEPAAQDEYHTRPVLGLSWTPHHRNLLLSCSADATVKLWDLTRESPMTALRSWNGVHQGEERVQAVEWNKNIGSGLDKAVLSAGERTVKVWDTRSVEDWIGVKLSSDVECVKWDPWSSTSFYVSLENGLILAYDSRTLSSSPGSLSSAQPKFTISAHDSAASALDVSPHIPGLLLTGGQDKLVKLWNILEEETEGSNVAVTNVPNSETVKDPSSQTKKGKKNSTKIQGRQREISMVTSRDLGVGKVFTARFSPDPDTPLTLAAAGSRAVVQIWDAASNPGARKAFGERLSKMGRRLGEVKKGGGVVGVVDESDEDD
ncbi:periodic tryptophan protein 1 [Tremella mesenterica]|uniref:Periodic tryptophan protein 1 n=1 Tax=Tremella mesenterica TaxID=5217 RepID=A0A4Q1BSL6_TREME|nr:periodic tryptophan protein 1 [Tremella mesenterica]